MDQFLDTFNTLASHPLVMVMAMAVLLAYTFLAKRSSKLPKVPLGLFILYFGIRLVWLLIRDVEAFGGFDKWMYITATILLSWAIVRLLFFLGIDYTLKTLGKRPLPKITRDLILLILYTSLAFILLRVRGGVDLTGLLATSAVLTAVIGLAAQSTLTNLFAGITLQLEHLFSIGDWITLGDHTGRVAGITWKSTQLVTREEEMVILPNTMITQTPFRNHSRPTERFIARLELGIDYDVSPNVVREAILDVLSHHSGILPHPAPVVRIKAFGEFAIIYQMIFWLENFSEDPKIKGEVNERLWYALRRQRIHIPFPTRDIRLHHVERRHQEQKEEKFKHDIEKMLEEVPILMLLDPLDRRKLANSTDIQEFGAHEFIVRQGDPGDSLYIIQRGTCDVLMKRKESGVYKTIAAMTEGQFFGEMSLLTGEPRTATVRAKTDTTVLSITKEAFRTILKENPAISTELANALAKRRLEISSIGGALSETDSPSRLLMKIKSFFGLN